MTGLKKIVLLILMLIAITLPQAVQNYHALTVHHHVSHCDSQCSQSQHFHIATEHCPIHEFVFYILSYEGFIPQLPKPVETDLCKVQYQEQKLKQTRFHFYFLRGPPISFFS